MDLDLVEQAISQFRTTQFLSVFHFHVTQRRFFVNIFEQIFLLARLTIVLDDLPRRWHASISDSWIFNVYFPKTFYTFILQLTFFTRDEIPWTTTLLRWLYWSILFRIISEFSNWASNISIFFFFCKNDYTQSNNKLKRHTTEPWLQYCV